MTNAYSGHRIENSDTKFNCLLFPKVFDVRKYPLIFDNLLLFRVLFAHVSDPVAAPSSLNLGGTLVFHLNQIKFIPVPKDGGNGSSKLTSRVLVIFDVERITR